MVVGDILTITLYNADTGGRRCGDCQLCCRLLPAAELHKPGNQRCVHQRHGKGCSIYEHRPNSCRIWSCRWLMNDDTADLSRPDRSHYVIDALPDYVTLRFDADGTTVKIPVMQIWCDPAYPDAHKDPALRAYIKRLGERDGMAAIIRYSSDDGFVIFPPALASDGQWHEQRSTVSDTQHTTAEILGVLGPTWEAVESEHPK